MQYPFNWNVNNDQLKQAKDFGYLIIYFQSSLCRFETLNRKSYNMGVRLPMKSSVLQVGRAIAKFLQKYIKLLGFSSVFHGLAFI